MKSVKFYIQAIFRWEKCEKILITAGYVQTISIHIRTLKWDQLCKSCGWLTNVCVAVKNNWFESSEFNRRLINYELNVYLNICKHEKPPNEAIEWVVATIYFEQRTLYVPPLPMIIVWLTKLMIYLRHTHTKIYKNICKMLWSCSDYSHAQNMSHRWEEIFPSRA